MEEEEVHIRIHAIRVVEFSQKEPETPIAEGEDFSVTIGLDPQTDRTNNQARILLKVTVRKSEDAASPVLASIATAVDFEFTEDNFLLADDDGNDVIRPNIVERITSIAYACTRGIFHTKVGHSNLSKLILPLIDVKDLTKRYPPKSPD